MRLIWILIGAAFAVCMLMCAIRDWQGDEQASVWWAGACIALGIVACLLYGFEYAPWWKLIDGRPMSDFEGRPWYDARETPIVYDRRLDPQPWETMD